ncbi:MAG: hypothetical protein Q9191_002745 [Dirinaria sp. TL-2023a]
MVAVGPSWESFHKADHRQTASSASQKTIAEIGHSDPNVSLYVAVRSIPTDALQIQDSISTQKPRLPQHFAKCSVDSDGNLTVDTSESLQSRLGELEQFFAPFHNKFLQIVAETDTAEHIERHGTFRVCLVFEFTPPAFVYNSNKIDVVWVAHDVDNGALAGCVTESPLAHEASAKTFSSKNKRPGSDDTFQTKRRKSCTHELSHPVPSSTVVGLKKGDDSKGSDDDDNSDFEELVDTQYSPTSIRIDNAVAIERCIDNQLKHMKQVGCRVVAKAWIKAKEPRKQTKYPYNGGDRKKEASGIYGNENTGELTKPPWWPSTEGWQRGEGCRHKEPDHLKKADAERLILLKHLLRKCPVAALQESTKAVQPQESTKPPPSTSTTLNREAMKYLKEVYRIRGHQERYEDNQIDGSTTISVALPINDGHRVSNGTTIVERHGTPAEDSPNLLTPSDALSPANSLDPSQQQRSRHGSCPLNVSNEACNELGLPSGDDMHVPPPRPEQNVAYPLGHEFSDLGSFDVSTGNGTRALEHRKFDHHPDEFRLALRPQNRNYASDQKYLRTAASSSFQGEQAYNPGLYSGNAGLPLACSGKSEWAGLTEHPAEAICARDDTLFTHGLALWPTSTFQKEQYDFGNASMCTSSMASIEQGFPPPQGKFRQSWDFQRFGHYDEARHCSGAAPNIHPSDL